MFSVLYVSLLLFLVLSCGHPIFRYECIIDSFLLCFVLLLNLIDFFTCICLVFFWPHQISSIKFDPLFCVHRHALFICKFASPCSMFVCLLLYLISNNCFSNTAHKVIKGLVDYMTAVGPSRILCDTVTLVFTLNLYWRTVCPNWTEVTWVGLIVLGRWTGRLHCLHKVIDCRQNYTLFRFTSHHILLLVETTTLVKRKQVLKKAKQRFFLYDVHAKPL